MNLKITVVGASRVGKTLFCINFAEYLGAKNLCYSESGPSGKGRGVIAPREARKLMVHPGPRCNGVVRTFAVHLLRRPARRIALIDTPSLKDKMPLPRKERSKLALTLQALQEADVVLHLFDLTAGDPAAVDFNGQIHRRLSNYCLITGKLLITTGTKADLLKGELPDQEPTFSPSAALIPVSSLTGDGFAKIWGHIKKF